MTWPRLNDGSIDWMTVFQQPPSGFIPYLDKAATSEQLRDCYKVIIRSLFTRKDDEEYRKTYYDIMEQLFEGKKDGSQLMAQKTKLRLVMNRMMNDRIRKAREYAEKQKKISQGMKESRSAPEAPEAVLKDLA